MHKSFLHKTNIIIINILLLTQVDFTICETTVHISFEKTTLFLRNTNKITDYNLNLLYVA